MIIDNLILTRVNLHPSINPLALYVYKGKPYRYVLCKKRNAIKLMNLHSHAFPNTELTTHYVYTTLTHHIMEYI